MNLELERKIWKQGFKKVAGIDESGRGPIAGPVTAAAVVVTESRIMSQESGLEKIKDSKELSAKQREELYDLINSCSALEWATGRVGSTVIDRINILEASKLAMKRATANLNKRLNQEVDFLLLDGNFKINTEICQKSVIRGDQKIFLIKAASIMAKVSRDRAMNRYHRQFPDYGFKKHKGYPTAFHRRQVKKIGPCEIHRKTFKPIKNVIE